MTATSGGAAREGLPTSDEPAAASSTRRPPARPRTPWQPVQALLLALLVGSFGLLLVVGAAGESAAKPGLGPATGWTVGDLGWAPGPALVTAMLWTAYVLGALGVLLHLRVGLPRLASRVLWAVVLLTLVLAQPFGSADHTNYAAYGQIAAHGGDPYLTPPNAWSAVDPITSAVRPPWDDTVSVYGPFATLLQALAAHLGQDNLRQTVGVWQAIVLICFLAVAALLRSWGTSTHRIEALWTFNPLLVGVGVIGAHVDLVAAALVLAVLWGARHNPWLAGGFAGLALSTKITTGVVLAAVLLAWWSHERRGFLWRATQFGLATLVVSVPLHVWAGPHVFDQLDRARRSVSLATPWRLLLEALDGPMTNAAARDLISVLAVLLFVVLTLVLTRLTRSLAPATTLGTAARGTFVLSTAYALSAPYSLPWYLVLTWATLPVLAASVLDRVLLAHLLAMTVAYVPGRVEAMTPAVERTTLWVRRSLVPYAVLLVWGWVTLAAASAWRRSPAPRPPAP